MKNTINSTTKYTSCYIKEYTKEYNIGNGNESLKNQDVKVRPGLCVDDSLSVYFGYDNLKHFILTMYGFFRLIEPHIHRNTNWKTFIIHNHSKVLYIILRFKSQVFVLTLY